MVNLLDNTNLKETLKTFKEKSETFRAQIKQQILNERVSLQTYKDWLQRASSLPDGISQEEVDRELKSLLDDPSYAEAAVKNLENIWKSDDKNVKWWEEEVERRVKARMNPRPDSNPNFKFPEPNGFNI